MRELKILAIVVFFTLVTYWGVEPFAHTQMHPSVSPADFSFGDIPKNTLRGNKENGKALVETNCITCHSIEILKIQAAMNDKDSIATYGIIPPDLSHAGKIYDKNYLAGFLKNPTKATHLSHKFNDEKPYGMPSFDWMSDQETADVIAYLASIDMSKITDKTVFIEACNRCHSMKYDSLIAKPVESMKNYLGTQAPDLSMMIRSKGEQYLNIFINEPSKEIRGVAMPRVGLNKVSQEQVISYMQKVGDRKKSERENLGIYLIVFMSIFALIAYLWKVKIWKEVE